MIIMVAWRCDQHSPMFGQAASSQTVTRPVLAHQGAGLVIDRVVGRLDPDPGGLALDRVVRPVRLLRMAGLNPSLAMVDQNPRAHPRSFPQAHEVDAAASHVKRCLRAWADRGGYRPGAAGAGAGPGVPVPSVSVPRKATTSVDPGLVERGRLARMAVEGRIGVDVGVVARRQVVVFAHAAIGVARIPPLRRGLPLGIEGDRVAQRVDHAVVEEHLPRRDIAQARACGTGRNSPAGRGNPSAAGRTGRDRSNAGRGWPGSPDCAARRARSCRNR